MTDLLFDADEVDADLVVTCRISEGPRADDPTFEPRPGDSVSIDDGAALPLPAVVLRRLGDEVVVRILRPHPLLVCALRDAVRSQGSRRRRSST